MITKHSDWELGAYLYEYNGAPIASVSLTSPITLLSTNFMGNCTKSYINNKFFYFDLSKDTYFLKCDVEFILRFFTLIKTDVNNTIYSLLGYWSNPLQIKTIAITDMTINTTANTVTTYKTGIYDTNIPKSIAVKNNSFYIGTYATDTVTLTNNVAGFYWSLMIKQI